MDMVWSFEIEFEVNSRDKLAYYKRPKLTIILSMKKAAVLSLQRLFHGEFFT